MTSLFWPSPTVRLVKLGPGITKSLTSTVCLRLSQTCGLMCLLFHGV